MVAVPGLEAAAAAAAPEAGRIGSLENLWMFAKLGSASASVAVAVVVEFGKGCFDFDS